MAQKEIIKKVSELSKEIHRREIKYGFNVPLKAWLPQNVKEMEAPYNNQYPQYICNYEPKTIYSGRFCAVSGFIFAIVDGRYSILVNLRGQGTPDYKGCWNAPCGYLEKCENSKQGIQRETFEECGFFIDLDDIKIIDVETDPEECNNGNVTIRHRAFLGKINPFHVKPEGGEENEVDSIKWVPIDEIDNYKWAFNHLSVIKKYAPKKIIRRIIEFVYMFVKPNKKYSK